MTTLFDIQNAPDRAAVIQANFELLDAIIAFLGINSDDSDFRLKLRAGRYVPQLWDPVTELYYDLIIITADDVRSVTLSDTGEA